MDMLNKNYISNTILALGFLCYVLYIYTMQFVPATIVMSVTLLIWIAFNCYCDLFDSESLSKVLSISGFVLSISIFFIFGIEQIPFPVGAIIFHGYGISIALLVFLLSLLPMLFFSDKEILLTRDQSQSIPQEESTDENYNIDDHWEVATESDLESGDYEVAA